MRLAATLSDAFREQEDARARAETVSAFLEKFDLEPHHAALLDHYDFDNIEQDGMHFLEALDRVRTIRQELSTLDVFQEDQRLGATSAIRMMEALAAKQERAYERLYHWLQHHLYLNSQQQQQQQQQDIDADAMDAALSHPFVRHSVMTFAHAGTDCHVSSSRSHSSFPLGTHVGL